MIALDDQPFSKVMGEGQLIPSQIGSKYILFHNMNPVKYGIWGALVTISFKVQRYSFVRPATCF